MTFFDVFDLKSPIGGESSSSVQASWGFDIDTGYLKRRFLQLQQVVHPDAHAQKSKVGKET
jgi:hypothetical protein